MRVDSHLIKTFVFPRRRLDWIFPVVLLVILASISLLAGQRVERSVRAVALSEFETAADELAQRIVSRMATYEQVLRGGSGLFAASGMVSRDEFARYVDRLDLELEYPGIQGVGFALRLEPEEQESHIQSVRSQGFAAYAVKPAGDREEITSILYLEPFDERNRRAFGYDMFSETVRNNAMRSARDTGLPSLSGPVKLLQESGQDVQPGVLLYLPVYLGGEDPGGVEARGRLLMGYVYSPFRMHDLMEGMIGASGFKLSFTLRDLSAEPSDQLLFTTGLAGTQTEAEAVEFQAVRNIAINGRTWHAEIESSATLAGLFGARLVTGSGLAISLLVSLLIGNQLRTRRRAENIALEMSDSLHTEKERAQVTLRSIADAVVTTDVEHRIDFVNPAAERMLQRTAFEARGLPISDVMMMLDMNTRERQGEVLLQSMTENRIVELDRPALLVRQDGSDMPIEASAAPIHDKNDDVIGCVLVLHDISDTWALADRMTFMAQHDNLTGLPNRVLLQDRLQQAIHRSQRTGRGIALLFIDLDQFKRVNDSLGHEAGDRLLKQVGHRLTALLRPDDTVCRQGGDEFVVLLDRLRRPEDAAVVAEKILQEFASPVTFDNRQLIIGMSIGISLSPQDSSDPALLLKQADTAMYHAKNESRGRAQYFNSTMSEVADRRLSLEIALRQALADEHLSLAFQPRVDFKGRRLAGCEALVRWITLDGTPISPGEFIPVAEECGLIRELDTWVLSSVCAQLRAWIDAGLSPPPLAVNVSLAQFDGDELFQNVVESLQAFDLHPSMLELEITESQMLQDAKATRAALERIRSFGVRIAIDDFGTGYSGLHYLQDLPADIIKIDRSFVSNLKGQGASAAIVNAVIEIARTMNFSVIAEGVETEDQAAFILSRGCHEMQGFLFSRPVSADAMTKILEENGGSDQFDDASWFSRISSIVPDSVEG